MKKYKLKKSVVVTGIILLIILSIIIVITFTKSKEKTYQGIIMIYDTDADFVSSNDKYILLKDDKYKLLDMDFNEVFTIDTDKKIYFFDQDDKYIIFYLFNDDSTNLSLIYDEKGNLIKEMNGYINILKDDATNTKYFSITDYTNTILYDENFNKIFTTKDYYEIKVLNNIIYPFMYEEDFYDSSNLKNKFTAYDLGNKKLFNFSNFTQLENYIIIGGEKNYLYNRKTKEIKEYSSYEYKNEKNILKNEKETFIIDYLGNTYKEDEINVIKYEKGFYSTSCENKGYILKNKDNKVVFSECASFYDLNFIDDNIILAYFTDEDNVENYKISVKIDDKQVDTDGSIEVIGKYVIVSTNDQKQFYDLNLNKVNVDENCKSSIISLDKNEYYCSKFKKYLMAEDLKTVKSEYNDMFCTDNACVLTNDKGQKALYSKGKMLSDFDKFYDIQYAGGMYLLKSIYGNKLVKIGNTKNKEELKKITLDEKYDDINIDSIISAYKLDDIKDIINNNQEIFKKYAYVVSKNNNISGFTDKVYNMFKYVAINKEDLDIDYFLYALTELKIKKVDKLGTNQAGVYYDYDKYIEILDEENRVIYHELMHFIDYNTKYKSEEFVKCDNKYYNYSEIKDKNMKCDFSDITERANFMTEGGAEYFMATSYNDGYPVVYRTPVAIFSALRYIYGEDVINKIFLDRNEVGDLYNLIVRKTGLSSEEYKDILKLFDDSTNIVDYNYDINEKIADALIKIYEAEKKQDYTEDFNFLTILFCIIDNGVNTKYKSIMLKHEEELLEKVSKATIEQYYIYPFIIINNKEYYISYNGFDSDYNYGKYKIYFNKDGNIINNSFEKIIY